jgi:DNA (cytosine-5)-methyltransferase 1
MKERRVIDLFCGCGGFSLGAHAAGFSSALAVDIDRDLTSSFKDNFPNAPLLIEDLSRIAPSSLLERAGMSVGEPDLVIGGPPCQGFSYMGKRNPDDKRNKLIKHFFRFISYSRPAFFVMENVPGLLSPEFAPVLRGELDKIEGMYHVAGPMLVDAADFGAATRRKRTLVIGSRRGENAFITESDIRHATLQPPSTVSDAIGDLPSLTSAITGEDGRAWADYAHPPDRNGIPEYARIARMAPPPGLGNDRIRANWENGSVSGFEPTRHTQEVLRRFESVPPGEREDVSKCPRLEWNSQCPTLRAGTGKDHGSYQAVRPIHPVEHRVISVREAARLQGFPDWFLFNPAKWHSFRMIGNSVSPRLAHRILSAIRNVIENPLQGGISA